MTDANPTPQPVKPAWMHFVNFDGRLTGRTAEVVKQVAEARGLTPQDLLAEILTEGLKAYNGTTPTQPAPNDVKVEPMTINAGNGGFHVLTFVADGYGNLVAEDSTGAEKARMPWSTEDDATDSHEEFTKLARQSFNH